MTVSGHVNYPKLPEGHPGWSETFNALDFVQFSPDGAVEVYFVNEVPKDLRSANILILPNSSSAPLTVSDVKEVALDAHLLVTLNPPLTPRERLDAYEIRLVESKSDGTPGNKPLKGFDPRRSAARFSALPAVPPDDLPEKPLETPEINYLSKDFTSFKQLMLDRLSMTLPQWTEQNPSDLLLTLVEVMAYVADYLSYFQDSVATEAFLNTARRRISVRRLARLIDYTLHEGCNARAWVCVQIDQESAVLEPPFCVYAGHDSDSFPNLPKILGPADLRRIENVRASYLVYEPVSRDTVYLFKALNLIRIHTFGGRYNVLPKGATSAVLVDCLDTPSRNEDDPPDTIIPIRSAKMPGLGVGDVLIFEECVSPITKQEADKDTLHRHAVRLTSIRSDIDHVTNTPILHVSWDTEDALPSQFVLSVPGDRHGSEPLNDVTIVRGNVILVDHGRTIPSEQIQPPPVRWYKACGAPDLTDATAVALPSLFSIVTLSNTPLTHAQPMPAKFSATAALIQDERAAIPAVSLKQADGNSPNPIQWSPQSDLLRSEGDDAHFVAEIDDQGRACLRFGDGINGRLPDPTRPFEATYRIGNGVAGNVGAEQIKCLAFPYTDPPQIKVCCVRNPLAATGGTEPESVDKVRVYAPTAFQQVLERAVTPDDYVELAERLEGVQRAAATIRWSGTRQIITIAIDPIGTDKPVPELRKRVRGYLERYRLIGQEIFVDPVKYVPIDLDITIVPELAADAFHLTSQIYEILGNGRLRNGELGFFHPDNFTFGMPVAVNRIVTACKIKGVKNVTVNKLRRLNGATAPAGKVGDVFMGDDEIAQLDYDPLNTLRGRLNVHVDASSGGSE